MTEPRSASAARPAARRGLVLGALALMLVVFGWKLALLLDYGVWAVRNPHELDYGEGIVWQQMRMIMEGRGYGPIDGFPSIVFHYPPVYHAVTWLTATLSGLNQLMAGRLVSMLSTLGAAVFVGLTTSLLVSRSPGWVRASCGATAALAALTCDPLVRWAPLMRVDMVATMLTFAGVYLAMLAVTRPKLIYLASAAFVAAVFSKQTMIAAPAAMFLALLVFRPRLAITGIVTCVVLGVIVLAGFTAQTHGGFMRHIFTYNINRFDFHRLVKIPRIAAVHGVYVLAAVFGLACCYRQLRPLPDLSGSLRDVIGRTGENPAAIRLLMAFVYAGFASVFLLMFGKVGSNINYLIEWFLVVSVFAGLAIQPVAASLRREPDGPPASWKVVCGLAFIPLAFALQAASLPLPDKVDHVEDDEDAAQLVILNEQIKAATKPIISDNMVILIEDGKEVVWEPAIFAELASTGIYDERLIIKKIRDRDFAFFITAGSGDIGRRLFEQRYTPTVAKALNENYPRTLVLANFTVHYPAAPQP